MAEQSLKDKTVKGVGWSAADNLAQYIVSFVVGIILARLLSPDDYGLLGIIAIFTAICTTLINGGFNTALIREKNVTEDDYNTVFIVNLGMSLLLYLLIYLCAPLIASFFERDELISLVRVASVGMIIGAVAIIQQTILTIRLDFKTQTKITFIGSIGSGIIGISMALMGFGVWALVFQGLTNQLFKTILLWLYNKWLPSFRFSRDSFQRLFGFGWKIMLSGVLDTAWKELYQVVVGKFYNSATLGQYSRAKQFSQLFSNNLTSVIQRVTYPVLSNIQDDKERMINTYRKIIKMTMFVTAICMFSLAAISEPLLYCLIGPKWSEAATYLPLLCITGSLYPLHAINLNMLQVQGRSDLFLGLEIVKKVLALGPLFIGAFVGIMPMLYASVLVGVLSFFLNSFYSGKFLGYSSWMQVKDIAPSYLVAIIISVVVYFVKFVPLSNWIVLPIQIVTIVVLFVTLCKLTRIPEYEEMKSLIRSILSKRRI